MSRDKDREQRDLDLMLKSYQALKEEQANPSTEPFTPEPVGRRRRSEDRRANRDAEPSSHG